MKLMIAIVLTALLGFALPLYLWWWSFVFASFLVAVVMKQKPLSSFVCGFIAITLLWAIQAAVLDARNDHLLSRKVALLLPFNGSVAALLAATAIIGGLVSGMAALAGSYLVRR